MEDRPFVTIGRIIKTHGVKGEVSFAPAGGLPFESLQGLTVWVVPPTLTVRETRIDAVRPGPKGPLLTLRGVETVEHAAELRDHELTARAEDLPEITLVNPLDMVGWHVVDLTRGDIGSVTDVIVTGANDVWVVEGPYGQVCVPVIDDVVESLDEAARVAAVKLLPGLMDEDGAP